jgi:hypothetical protein
MIDEWIKKNFSGHGAAIRAEGDTAVAGEPFMSMEIAKDLAKRAFALGRDVAFTAWLEKLADEFRSSYGFTPLQVEQYVTQQPEVWRDYFNDDYTPADAAHEDALAGAD